MDKTGPVFDVLSAFYNVRTGLFGPLSRGRHIALPTFSRRGNGDIIIARVVEQEKPLHPFFPPERVLCKVLVDPDTFGTKGRDIYFGMDEGMIPQRMVVKGVIGLGDARGVLRETSNVLEYVPLREPLVEAMK